MPLMTDAQNTRTVHTSLQHGTNGVGHFLDFGR